MAIETSQCIGNCIESMLSFKTSQISYNEQSHDCVLIAKANCYHYGLCNIYIDVDNRKALCVQDKIVISEIDLFASQLGIFLFAPINKEESEKYNNEINYLCAQFAMDISERLDKRIAVRYMSSITQ